MKAIFKKELWLYFGTPTAYIVALLFAVISSLFLWFLDTDYNVFLIGNADAKSFFQLAPWLLLFLIPALTMRSFAEEYSLGTLQWLFSKPLKIRNIILGKYFSLVVVIVFCLSVTYVFIYTISQLSIPAGNIDRGVIASGYVGLFLLCLAFLAIGIWCSMMSKNVIYAYLLALFINFFMYFGFDRIASFDDFGSMDFFIKQLGFIAHYDPFTNGLVDSRNIFYFTTLALLFLGLTHFSILKQK